MDMLNNADIKTMAEGYVEAALWADLQEGSNARVTQQLINKALDDCSAFVSACGVLVDQAVEIIGAESFGRDFYLTRCGHGAGFWDRSELEVPCIQNWFAVDRNGESYLTNERGSALGDALSAIAYGTHARISRFSSEGIYTNKGWVYHA
jgi:hypothetical protein